VKIMQISLSLLVAPSLGHLMWWHNLWPLTSLIIVAIIVGCLIAVIILICIIVCVCRRRRKRSSKSKHSSRAASSRSGAWVGEEELTREEGSARKSINPSHGKFVFVSALFPLFLFSSSPSSSTSCSDSRPQLLISLLVSLFFFFLRSGMEKSLVNNKPNDPNAEPCENYENLPFHGLQNPPTKVSALFTFFSHFLLCDTTTLIAVVTSGLRLEQALPPPTHLLVVMIVSLCASLPSFLP
jgi:MFS family permease